MTPSTLAQLEDELIEMAIKDMDKVDSIDLGLHLRKTFETLTGIHDWDKGANPNNFNVLHPSMMTEEWGPEATAIRRYTAHGIGKADGLNMTYSEWRNLTRSQQDLFIRTLTKVRKSDLKAIENLKGGS